MSTTSTIVFQQDIGIPQATIAADLAARFPSVSCRFAWANDDDAAAAAATAGDGDEEQNDAPVHALVTVTHPFTAEIAAAHPDLLGVAVAFTGYDAHDTSLGVPVFNAAGYSTPAVAELAVGLTLSALRGLAIFAHATEWTALAPGRELGSCTVGIVGTGAIGCAAARLYAAFGCKVKGWSRSESAAFTDGVGGEYVHDLAELVATCDIVSLHVPLNDATRHLIGTDVVAALRPGAVLVNTARGGVVDTAAVLAEMRARRASSGTSFVYATDVFEDEPLPADSPFFNAASDLAPFLVLSHHVAYKTAGALARRWEITLDNLDAILNRGGVGENRVN
ncbi:D-isomer specific 2-hydroxyacid dehydrogenase [Thecamonas trahens ATCC 50062]|uniref:D-isomer specific 2-hydroxyacid dehydrogenase n=1 Tax=Thecamonas trahens ATCC 50062 TaxID=461836 RepID=A0A0L0DU48_THETB|nr:D-isomer specific 2-hydroxyacid dehydrogenase [Thecamonas trahens ATCC 50062]KNC55790.1 D-isomer specific 2-hydroxyacid dehydrogenase [Thecamonas trahens ATCC 50062]|eukprot:XP_013752872.1 D-isomer specific 2-hydroxyacid dehydrogenase [Thecamonas trahens ATCC 50062]